MVAPRLRWVLLPAFILATASCSGSTVTVTVPAEATAAGPSGVPTLPPSAVTPDEIQNIVLTPDEVPGLDPVSSGALTDDGTVIGKGSLRKLEFGWYSVFGTAPDVSVSLLRPGGPPIEGIADGLTFATSAVAVLPLTNAREMAGDLGHEVYIDPELCDDYGNNPEAPPLSACPYARYFPRQDYALRIGLRKPVPCRDQTVPIRNGHWTWITCTWVLQDLRTYPQRGVLLTYSAGGGEHFDPQSFVELVESTSIVRALLASVESGEPSPSA
jgi:hypothetical protein